MGRKERRAMQRKVKHIQKTKSWEIQGMIREEYDRYLVDSRTNKDILAPGDTVVLDVEKLMQDPDWHKLKQEYKDYALAHANQMFTIAPQIKQAGAYNLVSFNEDITDPKWLWFSGYVKKISIDK